MCIFKLKYGERLTFFSITAKRNFWNFNFDRFFLYFLQLLKGYEIMMELRRIFLELIRLDSSLVSKPMLLEQVSHKPKIR